MQLNITAHDDDPASGSFALIRPLLGSRPYVLIEVAPSEDEGDIDLVLKTGGGIPRDLGSLGDFLDLVHDAVKQAIAAGATLPEPGDDEEGED